MSEFQCQRHTPTQWRTEYLYSPAPNWPVDLPKFDSLPVCEELPFTLLFTWKSDCVPTLLFVLTALLSSPRSSKELLNCSSVAGNSFPSFALPCGFFDSTREAYRALRSCSSSLCNRPPLYSYSPTRMYQIVTFSCRLLKNKWFISLQWLTESSVLNHWLPLLETSPVAQPTVFLSTNNLSTLQNLFEKTWVWGSDIWEFKQNWYKEA